MARKKTETSAIVATPEAEIEVLSYKGFNLDWTCRRFQYEIGKTYEHAGPVDVCVSGFHACEYPLDVFGYYRPGTSRYAEVTQSGALSRENGDTKIASARLTICVELSLHEIIGRAIKWIFDRTTPEGEAATGNLGAASATGYQGAASATGNRGRAMGAEGCAIFLVYRAPDTEEILHAWAGISGRGEIKSLTWYQLGADGQLMEVNA